MNRSTWTRARFLLPAALVAALSFHAVARQAPSAAPARPDFAASEELDKLVRETVAAAVEQFGAGGLTQDKIALTVIDLKDRQRPARASHRGQQQIYPASVVKLFYLAAAMQQMESGGLVDSPELQRAMRDMIVDSSNDATSYVVDALTNTTSGPELGDIDLRIWLDRRNVVNRYFARLGYDNINVNQKTWCEAPYGRERQGLGENFERRNMLTTEAVGRLLFEMYAGRAVSAARSRQMLTLMKRDPRKASEDPDDQATAFAGKGLPAGAEYYSKAGFTSTARHDAALIRLPNGADYILVVFTVDNSRQPRIIPFVSQRIAEHFQRSSPRADLILTNGRIWTGNPSQPWAEALAARDQRLTAVGSNQDVRALAGPETRVIDLQGRLALPGFIDDHTHLMNGGFQLLSVNLRDAATPEEFARRIRERAEKYPGRWITGGDWDHELWPGGGLPTRDMIDRYTPDTPVFVMRLDLHMGLANSLALRRAGITRETPDPPGGEIVRDAAGEPTGVLKDAAMEMVLSIIPDAATEEADAALAAALAEAARVGVTSVQDITLWEHWELYRRFHDAGRLTVRIYARTPMKDWQRHADMVRRQGAGDEWLRLGGLKAFMDGSLGSTTALFFEPYQDAPKTRGIAVDDIPEGSLQAAIRDADKAGLQCSIHAIGDRANQLLLNYFEQVAHVNGPRDRRFRIEHAQHLTRQDISRFAKLGVIPSMQPFHAADDGRWAEKRIGAERIKTTYAFRSLLDTGARLVFGSDWSVAPLSPLLGIHAAVTRATLDGKNPRGWVPEEKITVEEAVRAYTATGAYAEFAERDKGTLEVGKLADIVVLSDDIFRMDPQAINRVEVLYTIAGGRVVHQK